MFVRYQKRSVTPRQERRFTGAGAPSSTWAPTRPRTAPCSRSPHTGSSPTAPSTSPTAPSSGRPAELTMVRVHQLFFKGTVPGDFRLQVFFHKSVSAPSPWVWQICLWNQHSGTGGKGFLQYDDLCIIVADPDPRISAYDSWIRIRVRLLLFRYANKKIFRLLLFEGTFFYIIFQSEKVISKLQNSRNKGFSYYFCVMIEGSRSGSVPLKSD